MLAVALFRQELGVRCLGMTKKKDSQTKTKASSRLQKNLEAVLSIEH